MASKGDPTFWNIHCRELSFFVLDHSSPFSFEKLSSAPQSLRGMGKKQEDGKVIVQKVVGNPGLTLVLVLVVDLSLVPVLGQEH